MVHIQHIFPIRISALALRTAAMMCWHVMTPEPLAQSATGGPLRSDSLGSVLNIPSGISVRDFQVARVPPRIDYAAIHFPQYPVEQWTGFSGVGVGPDSNFYFALGNHLGIGGNAIMLRVDPNRRRWSTVFEAREVIGWSSGDHADGKIHGQPMFSPEGRSYTFTFSGPHSHNSSYASTWEKPWLSVRANATCITCR